MRYWLMTLAMLLFLFSSAGSQEAKKKDLGKEKDPKTPPSMDISDVQGRSFNEWQKDIQDKDPTRREMALKAIVQFGAEKAYDAVPAILTELKKHSNARRIDLSTCVTGTVALGNIIKFQKKPEQKDIKAAVSIFKTFLRDEQMMLRLSAAQNLPYLGPTCRDALPEVISLAREPSTWEARKEGIQVLGFIGYEDKGEPKLYVMTEVFKALDDRAAPVRMAALRSSAALAMKATQGVKTQCYGKFKIAIDSDPNKHVVLAAHMAHMMLEGKATPAHLNPLVKMLKDENPEVRLDAVQNIAALGKEAKSAVPKLLEAASDPEASVAVGAIMALATIDWESSRTQITRIRETLTYPEAVRNAAAEAIAFHENMAKEKKKTEK